MFGQENVFPSLCVSRPCSLHNYLSLFSSFGMFELIRFIAHKEEREREYCRCGPHELVFRSTKTGIFL